jgi:hypothetical protein
MRSGTPRSCVGPRRHKFYGGAAEWSGCPRTSLGWRETAWIESYDRSDGRLSVTEQLSAPMLLLEAFDAIDELKAQAEAHIASTRESSSGTPGVLR